MAWVLVLGLLVAALVAALVPAVASAGVYNVRPADISENPAEEFVDDDALMAIALVDPTGGGICIVEDSVTYETMGAQSCDRPAWGTTNSVVGIGTTFIPLEGPELRVGNWKLLGVDSEGTPQSLSETFTVTACATCSREIADAAVRRWKDSARQLALVAGVTCTGWGLAGAVKDGAGAIRTAHGDVKKLFERADSFASGDVGFAATIFPVAAGAALGGIAFPSVDGAIGAGADKAKEILKNLMCAVGAMYGDIVNDPPDPAFDQVAPPSFRAVPGLGDPATDALAVALDAQYAHAEASLHGFERYLGAVAATNRVGVHRQAVAAAGQTRALVTRLYDTVDSLRSYATSVDANPAFDGPIIATEDDKDSLVRTYRRVQRDGFTASELSELQTRGYTPAQITNILTHFDLDPSVVPVGVDLPGLMRGAADDVASAISGFDAFARAAGAVGARTDTVPQAAFAAAADTADPLTVVFTDTSENPDGDPLTVSWEFGDAGTAVGREVRHPFAVAGTYDVRQTVSDGVSSTSVTRSIQVGGTPNAAPSASFTATRGAGNAPLEVAFDASASTDIDGRIVSYAWRFGDGTLGSGVTPTHVYAAPGTYTATLTVTDDGGRTATATEGVVVSPAPVNRPPVATPDALGTRQGVQRSIDVLLNDTDPDGDTLRLADAAQPAHGTVTCEPTGACTYAPNAGFSGNDAFTYVVEDAGGARATGNVAVTVNAVNQPPTADAGPARTTTEDVAVLFDAGGSSDPDGVIASYEWDLGDGSEPVVTTQPSVALAYGRPGVFTARLIVTDDAGAATADTVRVDVANLPPSVVAGTLPRFRRAPVGITRAYAVTITTGASEPTALSADFGDGTPPVGRQVVGPGSYELEHAYDAAGVYDLTFTVTDSAGETASAQGQVVVADVVADAGPDVAVDEGASVSLGGATTPSDEHTRVAWNFGDGSPTALADRPDHVYRDDGEFTATVTVTDDGGTASDAARIAVANRPPTARISTVRRAAPGDAVTLRAIARDPGVDDVLSYRWSFGDGATGVGKSVEHRFDAAGTYTVDLRVEDGDGGFATSTATIVVGGAIGPRDSRGTDFWLTFPTNYSGVPTLTLSIAAETATAGEVTIPGLDFAADFTVTPGRVTTVPLPPDAQLSATVPVAQDLGIHVTAGADVTVYGLNRIQYTTDAFLGLPTDALGTTYRVVAYDAGFGGVEAAVVATANDTLVTITPSVALDGDRPAGTPFTVTLDVGEAYQLSANADLTGTLITSSRPVAAFGAHNCANVPAGIGFCDHLVEQLPPVDAWGRRFATMPLATRSGGDTFRILAADDDTHVSVNGVRVATLGAGGFHEQLIDGPSAVDADKPILVVQYSNGSAFDNTVSDPFMVILPPYEQFQASYTVATPASGFQSNFVNLVVPATAADAVRLDGELLPRASFRPIGTSSFVGAQVEVGLGDHRLQSPVPFGVTVYGFDAYDSYGYGGGLSLAKVATVGDLRLGPATEELDVGSEGCVDATAVTGAGVGVPDVRVDFVVTGATGASGFASTGADGVARYCYRGRSAGTEQVTASVGALSRVATKRWRLPNRGPVAAEDARETLAGMPLAVPAASLLANDSDPDGDAITVLDVATTSASHGTATFAGGTVTYTPDSGFSGAASFRYTVSDGRGGTAQGDVRVEVVTRPGISIDDLAVTESDAPGTTATFRLSLTGPSPRSVSVAYETASGTATSPGDFGARSGTATFAPGQTTTTVPVDITNDTVPESDEGFELRLTGPLNATLLRDRAAATIRDDDPPPQRAPVAADDVAEPKAKVVEPPVRTGDVPAETAADLLLACAERLVVLEDVVPVGSRVKLVGVADRRFAGQVVSIVFGPSSKVVAKPTVGADGSFTATAPLPPSRLRTSDLARYEARIGSHKSLKLKLARRMQITTIGASAGRVVITGRVFGPFAVRRADRTIELERRVSCSRSTRVATTMPRADGTFRISVAVPSGSAAVYRLRTKVRRSQGAPRPERTFTLPRGVDF